MYSYSHILPDVYHIVQYAGPVLCRESICCLCKVLEEHAVRLAASTQTTTFKLSRNSGTLVDLPHQTVYRIGRVSQLLYINVFRHWHTARYISDRVVCGFSTVQGEHICCFRKGQEEHAVRLAASMLLIMTRKRFKTPRMISLLLNKMFYHIRTVRC